MSKDNTEKLVSDARELAGLFSRMGERFYGNGREAREANLLRDMADALESAEARIGAALGLVERMQESYAAIGSPRMSVANLEGIAATLTGAGVNE